MLLLLDESFHELLPGARFLLSFFVDQVRLLRRFKLSSFSFAIM